MRQTVPLTILVAALVAILGATIAVSVNDAPAAADGDADGTSPPRLALDLGGERHDLALGTYCWGGMCADAVGVITPPEAVAVSRGAELPLRFDATPPPIQESAWTLFALAADAAAPYDGPGWLGWQPDDAALVSTGNGLFVGGDVPAGRYLLAVSVYFGGAGDASYGLLVDVR